MKVYTIIIIICVILLSFKIVSSHDTVNCLSHGYLEWLRLNFSVSNLFVIGNVHVDGNISMKRPYAMISDNTTQTMNLASTAYTVNFSTIEDNYLIEVQGKQNISVKQRGDYKIDISAIFQTTTPNKKIELWLQKNGVDIPRSNTIMTLPSASTEIPLAVPFIIDLEPTDKIRFKIATNDAGAKMVYVSKTVYSPATPSIIITIFKVSEIPD